MGALGRVMLGARGRGGPRTVPSCSVPFATRALQPELRSSSCCLGSLCHCVPNLSPCDGDNVLPSASSLAPRRRDELQPQQRASSGAARSCTLHGHLLSGPD